MVQERDWMLIFVQYGYNKHVDKNNSSMWKTPQITFLFPLLFYRLKSSIAIQACKKEALNIFKIQ